MAQMITISEQDYETLVRRVEKLERHFGVSKTRRSKTDEDHQPPFTQLIRRVARLERKVDVGKKTHTKHAISKDPYIVDPEVPHIKLSKRAAKRYAKMDADIAIGRNLITAGTPEDLLKYLRR